MWGKYLSCAKLQAHIAKLRKRNSFWQSVGSQAVQDICQRIDKAYQLFFKHNNKGVRPPGFKKVKKYKSFTPKCAAFFDSSPLPLLFFLIKDCEQFSIQNQTSQSIDRRCSPTRNF
jgi:transposase